MPKASKPNLTPLELQLMQALWQHGTSSVSGVQQALPKDLAYTTVQTMLNILERKGHVSRELHGRAYVYTARVTQDKAHSHAVRDLVDRMFGGSSEELVMSLLKTRQIDTKTIARLARQLEKEED